MADLLEECPGCQVALPPLLDKSGGRCPECGAAISFQPALTAAKSAKRSARNDNEDQAESRPTRSKRKKRDKDRPRNPYLTRLQLVAGAYFPFLGGMVLTAASLGVLVLTALKGRGAIALGIVLILTSLHIVLGLFALFQRVSEKDEFEIELPKKWQSRLRELVEQVASERRLESPDVIRLHAQSLAHVYLNRKGKKVLVIGGTLLALLPQRALAGIIAHELSHLTAGDVERSRLAMQWHKVMLNLEERFLTHEWAFWNPMVWMIRLYHQVYFRLLFASERCEEFLADSYYVDQVGAEEAATTLVLINVLDYIPWANLENMAESLSMANVRMDNFFTEQVRRLRGASKSDWDDALRKALKEETKWYSTHPALKARLKPLRVKAKDVLPLAMNMTGEPATTLFENWPEVERHLSQTLLEIAQIYFGERRQAMQDFAAVMKHM